MNTLKTWFWALLTGFVAALILCVIFFVMPALDRLERSFIPARVITVSAQGMTTATPDEADLSFSVVSQGQSPTDLSTDNNTKMNAVIAFVSSQGIATSDIATTAYDLQPNYQYNKDTQLNTINGYTLTQTVQVKIRDLTKVATIVGGLAPLGINQIGGINFTFQDIDKFTAIARADALTKAKEQAGELAAEAGASLGEVVSVGESQSIPYPQPLYTAAGSGAMSVPAVAPTIQPGTQNVTDSVTITYELR